MGATENEALVREYLDRVGRGDPGFAELFAPDIVWWVPPGSHNGGTYRGKDEVLGLIHGGVGQYSATDPMKFIIEEVVANDEWACVQMVLETRTAAGHEYRNHYHIAFRLRDGRIAQAREYVDTKYAADVFARG